jgi:DNA polymerase III delta prime subunit
MIYLSSPFHIEVNANTLGSNEKLFIGSFLKTYSQTRNIGLNIPKIIFVKNADLLSKQSQMALRKIIEKTSYSAKFIFEVSSLTKISEPLLSRFLLLRVVMPNKQEIIECLKNYSIRKNIVISDEDINCIIDDSCKISHMYNLKKIFGFYRYFSVTNKKFKLLYYDNFFEIYNIINLKKISFVSFQKIREIVNEMYINLVSMEELLFFLFNKLCIQFDNNNKLLDDLLKITVQCDSNLKKGNKECLHLEYYIISIIDLIHN